MRFLFFSSIREATAHIAAGNQPINVNCKKRQIKPINIFPLKKNDSQGNKTAINIIVLCILIFLNTVFLIRFYFVVLNRCFFFVLPVKSNIYSKIQSKNNTDY